MKPGAELYNQLLNVFWTALCCAPFLVFWFSNGVDLYFYIFLVISCTPLFAPANFLKKLVVSRKPKFYERLGVKTIRKFVQDGDLIKKASPRESTGRIRSGRTAKAYLQTIVMYEKYHLLAFIFFALTSCYAAANESWLMLTGMTAANLIYNVCPLLLQQYNRGRISALRERDR